MPADGSPIAAAAPEPKHLDVGGLTAAGVATLAWGMTGTFVHLVAGVAPGIITVARLAVSAAVLALVKVVRSRTARAARAPLTAVAAMAAYYVLATEAFTRAGVVEVTLLVSSSPLIAVCLELAKGRAVSARRLAGIAVALIGLGAFVFPGSRGSATSFVGDGLALGAALASALCVTRLRTAANLRASPDPVTLAMHASLLGAVVGGMLLLARGTPLATVSLRDGGVLLLLGAFSTAVPTVALAEASRRLPATVTTSLTLLTPLFAAVFAGLVLGEWPLLVRLPGALVMFVGLCVVVLAR